LADRELATPTGAVILRSICSEFSAFPSMIFNTIGYGAGTIDLPHSANILRIFIGEGQDNNLSLDKVIMIETNIDDMSPEIYGYVMERLFTAGALDVFITPIIMKKCRPAAKLSVILNIEKRDIISRIIFNETSTIGLRYIEMDRTILAREITSVNTEFGSIRIKVSRSGDNITNIAPEYEDCKDIAQKQDMPLKSIIDLAIKSYNMLK
jgi:hypothetical protein